MSLNYPHYLIELARFALASLAIGVPVGLLWWALCTRRR